MDQMRKTLDEDKLLARHIQVTKDMVALSRLCEPNCQGNRTNWRSNDDADDELLEKSKESWPRAWNVQPILASFVVVSRVQQHSILLHINFHQTERILFVVTSLILISSTRIVE